MDKRLCILLLILATALLILLLYKPSCPQKNCALIEFEQPPNDSADPISSEESDQLNDAINEESNEESEESFRIRGGGRGGMGRGGMGRGGRGGGMGRGGRGGGMGRGGRGGRGGGMGRGGLSWPWRWRPWRRWPGRYWGRPWRSLYWQTYPNYVYTYPLSYYTYDWEAPVKRYTVRIAPKADDNPFFGEGYEKGYTINGTSGARLDLKRGKTYEFDIYTSRDAVTDEPENEPFFFTTTPGGGSNSGRVFDVKPTVNGVVRITIGDETPSQFYYMSTNHRDVGGYVFVHS